MLVELKNRDDGESFPIWNGGRTLKMGGNIIYNAW